MKGKLPESSKEDTFILIEAESLSLKDKFMRHWPRTKRERATKKLIREVIRAGVKNFYRPKYDPSLADDGSIQFVARKWPAVGKSYEWWLDAAKNYFPARNSRLGTKLEYGAFLGVLIKKLVEEGWTVNRAWKAVCRDSKELGHYWNSENTKNKIERTASRCVCGFYDLANTYKFLAGDEKVGGFWVAGGVWYYQSSCHPIAKIDLCTSTLGDRSVVGWIVLSEGVAA